MDLPDDVLGSIVFNDTFPHRVRRLRMYKDVVHWIDWRNEHIKSLWTFTTPRVDLRDLFPGLRLLEYDENEISMDTARYLKDNVPDDIVWLNDDGHMDIWDAEAHRRLHGFREIRLGCMPMMRFDKNLRQLPNIRHLKVSIKDEKDVLAILSGSPSVERLDIFVWLKNLSANHAAGIQVMGKSLNSCWTGLRLVAVHWRKDHAGAATFSHLFISGVKASGMHGIIQRELEKDIYDIEAPPM